MATARKGLVLGAGGHAAIAWEIGVIAGLLDGGVDVRNADVIVGTSAGSIVGAQITAVGVSLDDLYRRQTDPAVWSNEPAPRADFVRWRADLLQAKQTAATPAEFLQRVGALAAAPSSAERDRRGIIAARLPAHNWPDRRLLIATVDIAAGARKVFDAASGAPLVDAVAASCAVAGIWPAVPIAGRQYVDGGFYSIDNADLAGDADDVLIVTLPARAPQLCVQSLDEAIEMLRQRGARVEVVLPDEATQSAIAAAGGNLLDPAVREGAARAGRAQGRTLSGRMDAFWSAAAPAS